MDPFDRYDEWLADQIEAYYGEYICPDEIEEVMDNYDLDEDAAIEFILERRNN